jgi:hypothetical protein
MQLGDPGRPGYRWYARRHAMTIDSRWLAPLASRMTSIDLDKLER